MLLEQRGVGLDDAGVALAALEQLAEWPGTSSVLARLVDCASLSGSIATK